MAWAVTKPSPSPSLEPSASPDTTEKLKERIEKVLNEQAADHRLETAAGKKKGLVGQIQRVTENIITVKNSAGIQTVTLTPQMQIIKKDRKLTPADLAIGDWITVLGYQKNEEFEPKRILVATKPLTPANLNMTIATLEEIAKPKRASASAAKATTLTLRSREDDQSFTAQVTKETKLLDATGETLAVTDLATQVQYLVLTIQPADDRQLLYLKALAPLDTPAVPAKSTKTKNPQ